MYISSVYTLYTDYTYIPIYTYINTAHRQFLQRIKQVEKLILAYCMFMLLSMNSYYFFPQKILHQSTDSTSRTTSYKMTE